MPPWRWSALCEAMGNLQSSSTKEDTQRANRLSKPLSKPLSRKSTVSTRSSRSSRHETEGQELNSGLIGWQNPWVGSSLASDARSVRSKAREIPPTVFETDSRSAPTPRNDTSHAAPAPTAEDTEQQLPVFSPVLASRSVRRASYQPGTYGSSQRTRVIEPPRRANSMQTNLTRQSSTIYEDVYEGATSSNTHFMVDNQRFSLTRRRSLLTRPGVATRRSTRSGRRAPSPIGEPPALAEDSFDDLVDFGTLQWPLLLRPGSVHQDTRVTRPLSPPDSRYTQLGALKLGSLRVVNGSTSPCSSDRIPLDSPGLGLSHIDTTTGRGQSTLKISAISNLTEPDDQPDSPFSFEKSPMGFYPASSRSLFPAEGAGVEDEGIALDDDNTSQSDKKTFDSGADQSTSCSLNKSDSGYSSAASVASHRRSRTRASFDSQASGSVSAVDNHARKGRVANDHPPIHLSNEGIQRHPVGLHDATVCMGNFSQLHPQIDRWYDSMGPAPQSSSLAAPRTRRSTLCAPRYTEYQMQKIDLASAGTASPSWAVGYHEPRGSSSRGSLQVDRHSTTGVLAVSDANKPETALDVQLPPSLQQLCTSTERVQTHMHQSTSGRCPELSTKHELMAHRARSRSGHGGRNWSQTPGIEAPPLPSTKSTDFLFEHGESAGECCIDEAARGRPRSRSQDLRRRKLTKTSQNEIQA
ncbi:Uncharacterized protein PECH_006768 [Penicillium ucsense]|uniref:Uncharacterized protein n=1 Tax=Penicillium ucsense TaxID=2839758 RepID=A0A8J8VWC6_9EURO|nr:Uncharacterized protein PECM_002273 [Penicillium ucsense]KAF7735355.1 Uncharacterized protein PECH_006768 [Penicillium ucsense]